MSSYPIGRAVSSSAPANLDLELLIVKFLHNTSSQARKDASEEERWDTE